MSKNEYIKYKYNVIKKNNNSEISCFIKNDSERYYKISHSLNINKKNLIKNILDIKKYKQNTNNFIIDVIDTGKKNVYAYKIYNELLKILHKVDIECHLTLNQIDENTFKFKNNRLDSNYFDDTYYIDINFIHVGILGKNIESPQLIEVYFNIDSSLCLFEFNDFWEEIEKFCVGFTKLIGSNKLK